jgi:hypothetical protein
MQEGLVCLQSKHVQVTCFPTCIGTCLKIIELALTIVTEILIRLLESGRAWKWGGESESHVGTFCFGRKEDHHFVMASSAHLSRQTNVQANTSELLETAERVTGLWILRFKLALNCVIWKDNFVAFRVKMLNFDYFKFGGVYGILWGGETKRSINYIRRVRESRRDKKRVRQSIMCRERKRERTSFYYNVPRLWLSVLLLGIFIIIYTNSVRTIWSTQIQFVPHRKHITSPLQSPTG